MSRFVDRPRGAERFLSAFTVLLVQALLGYVLVMGLRGERPAAGSDALAIFTVLPEPSPPHERRGEPPRLPVHGPSGARHDRARRPAPVFAPPPLVALAPPPPVIVAPMPATDTGQAFGPSDRAGSGAGQNGAGTGRGTGYGSGEIAIRARLMKGRFRDSDFPRSARDAGTLAIRVRYVVRPDGRVGTCEVVRPSSYVELDAITCPIIQRRYRFEPARDSAGRAVEEVKEETEGWRPSDPAD
ncbi:energy transducer TonB [Flavisphingomonas formosensis]|uniref:energy transducer TonB n=1 Tax=Flavisphingomonas formosensis TaxID=861534 RepID=UPI0012F8219F|nr:energy transducer TonB [Sphingomonas formosensis]